MAEMSLDEALGRAVRHHQAGELNQAESLYRYILQRRPGDAAALHLLGVIRAQNGQAREAADLIAQAIAIDSGVADYHVNYGRVLQSLGRIDEAIAAYRVATALDAGLVDAHFQIGLMLQSQGKLDEAEAAYRRVVELKPGFAPVHNNLGTICLSRGQLDAAEQCFRRAIAVNPLHASAQSNLAGVLVAAGRTQEAADAYRRLVGLSPESAGNHLELGRVLHILGRFDEAASAYRQSLVLDSHSLQAKLSLSSALLHLGRVDEALGVAREAAAEFPHSYEAAHGLALVLERAGKSQEALETLQRAAELSPDPERIRFDLAALGKGESPAAAPRDYVQAVFDGMASRYDEHLVKRLYYDVPRHLYEAVRPFLGEGKLDVADLGCGTGLSGVPFRPIARSLLGADLSGRMIELARGRSIYDELHQREVVEFLGDHPAAFDLIISADLFVYIGELKQVMDAAVRALRPGGWMVFSVESQEEPGFSLRPSRRYSHSRKYLQSLAQCSGLETKAVNPVTLRLESGKPVAGYAIVLQKPVGQQGPDSA